MCWLRSRDSSRSVMRLSALRSSRDRSNFSNSRFLCRMRSILTVRILSRSSSRLKNLEPLDAL